MSEQVTPGTYAEAYARNGWAVIPIWWVTPEGRCACGDPACPRANWGKHPLQKLVPAGLKDATTDAGLVKIWWEAYPEANVAVVCDRSNLIVLDVDPRNGGDEAWARVEASYDVPVTVTASTGGGGRHVFLRDDSLRATGRRPVGKITPGLDVKWSGYVLVAPSNHASGGRYTWDNPGVNLADCAPVLDLLLGPGPRDQAPEYQFGTGQWGQALDVAELFDGVPEGGRHQAFVSYAASLRARRVREVEAELLVSAAWSQVDEGDHPFPLTEALRILRDTYAARPEGTSDEVELEGYRNFIEAHKPQPVESNGAGEVVTPANGHSELWTPRDEARAVKFAEAIGSLPEELAPIRDAVLKQQLQLEARTLVTRIQHLAEFEVPAVERLDLLLTQEIPEPDWVISGLHEHGTNSSLTATYKAGKTTLQLNLMRSLIDGAPFLDVFPVRPLSGNIVFFNYELTRSTFVRWATRLRMVHPERIFTVNLRGRRLELGLERTREWVADTLRKLEAEFWIADPFARAFYGDENSNTEVKLWTDAVDEIKERSGCPNFQVTLHTGRGEQVEGEERARGATRIDDWVDARWILARQNGARFFSARGRDIDEENEGRDRMLMFDPDTWRLSAGGVTALTRAGHRDFTAQQKVVDALNALGAHSLAAGVRISRLRGEIRGNANEKRGWVDQAVAAGAVQTDGSVYWLGEPVFNPVTNPLTIIEERGL